MPAVFQTLNIILWTFNVYFRFVENIWLIFFWMIIVGGLYGSAFTNSMFMANAKTDLSSDLHLDVDERELVVNIFLAANYIGKFYAIFLSAAYFEYFEPRIIYYSPDWMARLSSAGRWSVHIEEWRHQMLDCSVFQMSIKDDSALLFKQDYYQLQTPIDLRHFNVKSKQRGK